MTNLEHIVNHFKEQNANVLGVVNELCRFAYYTKHGELCGYDPCGKCEFYDKRDAFEYLLAEHKE